MESAGMLASLGLLGIIASVALAFVLLFFQPIWAFFDCIRSRRGGDANAVLLVVLFITWGVGTLIYGVFFTPSRRLRIFSLTSILLPLVILIPSVISLVTGSREGRIAYEEQERAESTRLSAAFRPGVASEVVDPFTAVRFERRGIFPKSASLTRFTSHGPETADAMEIDVDVRHIAHDGQGDRYFAVTGREFGSIAPTTGRFTPIAPDHPAEFFHPVGVAFDTTRGAAIVVTAGGYRRFFRYDPSRSTWDRLPGKAPHLPLAGLVHVPEEDCLYALERPAGTRLLETIHRFSVTGEPQGSVTLDPPIPVPLLDAGSNRVHYSSGKLVLLLPPLSPDRHDSDRIFLVDPASGAVSVPAG